MLFRSIQINISSKFPANLVAVIGAIIDRTGRTYDDGKYSIIVEDENIQKNLIQNGFLSHFGYERDLEEYSNIFKYDIYDGSDSVKIAMYTNEKLISSPFMPTMSRGVEGKIAEGISEIFSNAITHAQANNVHACGQVFKNDSLLCFTIVDVGVGIASNVNNFLKLEEEAKMADDQAIVWATKDGNTTKDIPGGYGLDILKRFISKNNGIMQIISQKGYYEYGRKSEIKKLLSSNFPGTIVNLQFRTDDKKSYILRKQ